MGAYLRIAFAEWKESSKTMLTSLLLAIIIFFQIIDFEMQEHAAGKHVTIWISPYLMYPLMLVALSLSLVALFGHVPYTGKFTEFVIIRYGRFKWFFYKIISILISTLLFSIYITVLPIIISFPFASFQMHLDSAILPTIAGKSAVWASGVELLIIWLVASWLAMIMMLVNLVTKREAGIPIGCIMCLFSYVFQIYKPFREVFYISPINWMNIQLLDWGTTSEREPTGMYAIIFLISNILAFGFASWLIVKKSSLNNFVRRSS